MAAELSESQLRDYVAANLHIIEPGLELRACEYHLPSAEGSTGRIDILAIDRFGAMVIIELKKSDRTSRQALHELHKYVSLLKHNHGLTDAHLRCVLLSTHWHELLVPFSEFAAASPWVIHGYRMCLDSDGVPTHAERIAPLSQFFPLRFCRRHYAVFFDEARECARAMHTLEAALADRMIPAACVLALDYQGKRPDAPPCALYVALAEFDDAERALSRSRLEEWGFRDHLGLSDPSLEEVSSLIVLSRILRNTHPTGVRTHVDMSPEQLTQLLQDWVVRGLYRRGARLASKQVYSDDDIIRLLTGVDGGNAYNLDVVASPERSLGWIEAKRKTSDFLGSNETWREIFDALFVEIERQSSAAAVTGHFFRPPDPVMVLYQVAGGVYGAAPYAELIVTESSEKKARLVVGGLAWNGVKISATHPNENLPDGYHSLAEFHVISLLTEESEHQRFLEKHGLRYCVWETTFPVTQASVVELKFVSGVLSRVPTTPAATDTLREFRISNGRYLLSLVDEVAKHAIGL